MILGCNVCVSRDREFHALHFYRITRRQCVITWFFLKKILRSPREWPERNYPDFRVVFRRMKSGRFLTIDWIRKQFVEISCICRCSSHNWNICINKIIAIPCIDCTITLFGIFVWKRWEKRERRNNWIWIKNIESLNYRWNFIFRMLCVYMHVTMKKDVHHTEPD